MQKVYFHTFGCRVNQYETEAMREKLVQIGYDISENFAESDLCMINSCSVTAQADQKCRQFVRKVLRENPKVRMVLTGCYATRAPDDLRAISPRIEVFSNQEKDSIPEIVSGCSLLSNSSPLLTLFHAHTRAFLKVQDGCDATCTYCIIPRLRPQMESRSLEEIRSEFVSLVRKGYKEIVLTGIRLGSYGLSSSGGRVGKTRGNLVALLQNLIQIPGKFRIRLSSLEITELTDELISLARSSDTICRNFHLPLQS
ncbi:MAG: radical SAM protein, partial [Elusimicrobia bacterium]|nr:radical SAM protein [Elusimicrobiota bacterium]